MSKRKAATFFIKKIQLKDIFIWFREVLVNKVIMESNFTDLCKATSIELTPDCIEITMPKYDCDLFDADKLTHRQFLQVNSGLRQLHSIGIIHRDITAQNICISGQNAEIIDFGAIGFANHALVLRPHYFYTPEKYPAHATKSLDSWLFGLTALEITLHECLTRYKILHDWQLKKIIELNRITHSYSEDQEKIINTSLSMARVNPKERFVEGIHEQMTEIEKSNFVKKLNDKYGNVTVNIINKLRNDECPIVLSKQKIYDIIINESKELLKYCVS